MIYRISKKDPFRTKADYIWIYRMSKQNRKYISNICPLFLFTIRTRLQNSPYFCVFKYARAVKQKVCNEAENKERDCGDCGDTLRFTDFFTDFEKKITDFFAV